MIGQLLLFILISLCFGWTTQTRAFAADDSDSKRSVELELEEIPGATAYEIELKNDSTDNVQTFNLKTPNWKARIRPGQYSLRMRSFDHRNVPGPWSSATPVVVKLQKVKLLTPTPAAEILSKEEKTATVKFSWTKISEANKYEVTVIADNQDPIVSTTRSTEIEIELPVAKAYRWSVAAMSKNEHKGDADENQNTFTLIGAPLEAPEIQIPDDKYVTKINWAPTQHAVSYNYSVQRKDGKWKKLDVKKEFVNTEVPIAVNWPGGKYKVSVQANSNLREKSKTSSVEFEVWNGDRSPAAVEEAKLRESLEKPSPWYFVASYLITEIQYTGVNSESQMNTSYPATGGTGRLGLGYISEKSNRGFLGMIDYSGFIVANKNFTYGSAEGHYVWKYTWGRNMLRPSGGLYYKEHLETFNTQSAPDKYTPQKTTVVGGHAGFDFWRPLTSKLGVQLNARYYMGLMGLDSPNGKDIDPGSGMSYGLMGSYKLGRTVMGFMGYAYRTDEVSYEASTSQESSSSSASSGQKQSIQIEGSYLNLMLEMSF
jgi:hypothetical protein